jgi:hypothetical protein
MVWLSLATSRDETGQSRCQRRANTESGCSNDAALPHDGITSALPPLDMTPAVQPRPLPLLTAVANGALPGPATLSGPTTSVGSTPPPEESEVRGAFWERVGEPGELRGSDLPTDI